MGSMTWALIRPPDGLLTAREGERRSETLLPTRNGLDGNLWRRFVDDSGKVLSLKDLRELEPLAFEQAGL
jgi:hypothetical protein